MHAISKLILKSLNPFRQVFKLIQTTQLQLILKQLFCSQHHSLQFDPKLHQQLLCTNQLQKNLC